MYSYDEKVARSLIHEVFGNNITSKAVNHKYYDGQGFLSKKFGWVSVHNGAFRTTIVSSECDFILKTPRDDSGFEQCEREELNFKKAIQENISEYFATFYAKFTFSHHNFYAFEKIDIDEDENCGFDFYEYCREIYYMTDTEFDRIRKFLWDKEINDVHCHNYGLRNDLPVLTDYAGSWSSCDDEDYCTEEDEE